jgi:hypothetical protein
VDGAVKLAELKGYITAKVDQYTEMANTCVKSISIDRVITDMNNILDLIIDMQGYKEKKTQLNNFWTGPYTELLSTVRNIRDLKGE